jgi:hypothetical protein
MAIDLEHFERSLNSLTDARAVMDKARAYMDAWPDLYQLARKTAADYLLQHTGKVMDPDRVWWHVFDRAASAPTFTGWRHSEAPKQSMTFTQLLVHRFNEGFQLAPDALPVYSGFYSRGSGADEYDEHNEVPLAPGKVMGDFWALDFASLLSQRTERFWREHGSDFTLLAKVRLIAMIEEGLEQQTLTPTDRQRLRAWLGLGEGHVQLAGLQNTASGTAFHIRHYLVTGGGHLITLRASDGRTVLYCPGTDWLPRAFADNGALAYWISDQMRLPGKFEALYRVSEQSSPATREQVQNELLARIGPVQAPAWPFGIGREVSTDLFSEMRDWAQTDLAVTHTLAVSNGQLRKSLWRGYLGAFLRVFSGFPALAWPLGLVMLGAATTRLSLDIDAAVRARSTVERTQAIISAVADLVAAAFAIIDVGLGTDAVRFAAYPHERLAATPVLEETGQLNDQLEGLDGNRILPEPSTSPGLLNGVSVDADGSTWIEMDSLELRVRHSPEAGGWLAVDEDDPFAFLPSPRLQVKEFIWSQLEVPQPVEAQAGNLEQMASGFWNTYMQEDAELSTQMSLTLVERQRQTLSEAGLPRPSADNPLLQDAQGYRSLSKDGASCYSWFENDQFHNDLVLAYTDEMTQANNLFRHGRGGSSEMFSYLTHLFDSLEYLPKSGAVRMWRGGSAQRATGGAHFRSGELNRGDVLVTTDITSFTENPYALRSFVAPKQMRGLDHVHVFDDTSVVYELVSKGLHSGVPIGPMSLMSTEAEVLFSPGRFLRIESIREVQGAGYRFIKVMLREVEKPAVEGVYDLRTGEAFNRAAYAGRVGHEPLVERFFPAAQWP